jgi:hypothetical protein
MTSAAWVGSPAPVSCQERIPDSAIAETNKESMLYIVADVSEMMPFFI